MRILIFLSLLAVIPFFNAAQAGEPYECGVPLITDEDVDAKMPTETGGRCDIHDRRFAYREEALKMKALLNERQRNYAAPRTQIEKQYKERLEALNQERGSPSDYDSYDEFEPDNEDSYEESYLVEDDMSDEMESE